MDISSLSMDLSLLTRLTVRIELSVLAHLTVVIYEALCFDVAQGQMNGAPNETRTHSCRFTSLVC